MEGRERHADHLDETYDSAKNQPCQVYPVLMQPVVKRQTDQVSNNDGCRKNKSYLRVAGQQNQRIFVFFLPSGCLESLSSMAKQG